MSKITSVVIFSAGVAVGVVASQQYFKKRYEEISNEEIESVKQAFHTQEVETGTKLAAEAAKSKPDLTDYAEKLRENGYTNYSVSSQKEPDVQKEDPVDDAPYVISPEEFGEFEDYSQVSLTYYAGDDILADDLDEEIDDVADTVGESFADHFGDYEDDSVFIRNDAKKTDYEILLDQRDFSNVIKSKPRQVEVED